MNRKTLARISVGMLAGVAILMPLSAEAASATFFGPIVPAACNCTNQANPNGGGGLTTAPSYACVLATLQNLVNFVISMGCILATLALVYAGFTWMTAGGNPEARSKGRSMLINIFIGLVIVLAAWLIVDFVMKRLYAGDNGSKDFGPWNSILSQNAGPQCIQATKPSKINGIGGGLATGIFGGSGSQVSPTAPGGTGVPATGKAGTDKLNVQSAVTSIDKITATQSSHKCLTAVQNALSAGGVTLSCPNGYAGQCNGPLQSLGFQSLGSSDSGPQAGDIVVIQHVNGSNSIGHIAMFNGTNWVSDFVQSNNEQPPGNPYPANQFGGAQYWRP